MLKKAIWTILSALLVTSINCIDCDISQIHLSLGDNYYIPQQNETNYREQLLSNKNDFYLVWTAQSAFCNYTVQVNERFGEEITEYPVNFQWRYNHNSLLDQSPDASFLQPYQEISFTVLISNLTYDTRYEYRIQDSSQNRTYGPFHLLAPNKTNSYKKILLIGELDTSVDSLSLVNNMMSKIVKDEPRYAAVMQLGEVKLKTDIGIDSNYLFNQLQLITKSIPLVMPPSNYHSSSLKDSSLLNFRIRNPLFNITKNQYSSFNLQGIHFLLLDLNYFYSRSIEEQNTLKEWIKNDLAYSNSNEMREQYPFIVVGLHRQHDCSVNIEDQACIKQQNQKKEWDSLFVLNKVDLVFQSISEEDLKPPSDDYHKSETKDFTEQESNLRLYENPNQPVYVVHDSNDLSKRGVYHKPYVVHVSQDLGYGQLEVKSENKTHNLFYKRYSGRNASLLQHFTIRRDIEGGVVVGGQDLFIFYLSTYLFVMILIWTLYTFCYAANASQKAILKPSEYFQHSLDRKLSESTLEDTLPI